MPISRRNWIKGFGGAMLLGVLGTGMVSRRLSGPVPVDLSSWPGFSAEDVALLNEIAETIIPETDTPGARAADVGAFIAVAVSECFDAPRQAVFVSGLRALEDRARDLYRRGFEKLSNDERFALLSEVRGEQQWRELWNRARRGLSRLALVVGYQPSDATPTPHYFSLLTDLVILGYCTSQAGATVALRHLAIPGDYNGALPYKAGDGAWSM